MKILNILDKKITGVILIIILVPTVIYFVLVGTNVIRPPFQTYGKYIEHLTLRKLFKIYEVQEEFKSAKIKDQNKNGIGEYANTLELVLYMDKKEKYKNYHTSWDIRYDSLQINESDYIFHVFLPTQVDEKEGYWLCLAIPGDYASKGSYGRSYFLDNKNDIIFYAERDSMEELKESDKWSLKRIFLGEPFKSPIDTNRWKISESKFIRSK